MSFYFRRISVRVDSVQSEMCGLDSQTQQHRVRYNQPYCSRVMTLAGID